MNSNIYQPRQPSTWRDKKIQYQEFSPSSRVGQFIYCYWQLRSTEVLTEDYHYKVVADGCIDFIYDLKNDDGPFVIGFHAGYKEFNLGKDFDYFGVRFLPAVFPWIYKISAEEVAGQFQSLDQVVALDGFERSASLFNGLDADKIGVDRLDHHFEQKLSTDRPPIDHRFLDALQAILRRNGNINLEEDLNTGVSPRQLRRLFKYYVGTSPKSFSKVVRFQTTLQQDAERPRYGLFYDHGYYDQAHFIKEFKNY